MTFFGSLLAIFHFELQITARFSMLTLCLAISLEMMSRSEVKFMSQFLTFDVNCNNFIVTGDNGCEFSVLAFI